jgi:hypothetical protein
MINILVTVQSTLGVLSLPFLVWCDESGLRAFWVLVSRHDSASLAGNLWHQTMANELGIAFITVDT